MRRVLWLAVASAVSLAFIPVHARADSFGIRGGNSGDWFWFTEGSGQQLHVEALVETVFRESLGLSFAFLNGALTFDTGPQTGCEGCSPSDMGGTAKVTFSDGGSFVVTASGFGDLTFDDTTELLRASFQPNNTATFRLLPDGGGDFGGTGAFSGMLLFSFIHPDLLDALSFPRDTGIGDGSVVESFVQLFWDNSDGPLMVDAVIDKTDIVGAVPEAGTLFLLGSGVLLLVGFLRKKLFSAL